MTTPDTVCNKQKRRFLTIAASEAHKSTMLHQHGCVVVHDNDIVCSGFNKAFTHMSHQYSLHAEVVALHKVKGKNRYLLTECDMYVVRVGGTGGEMLRLSKPCPDCQSEIAKLGIKRVFYSVSGDG